MAYWTIEFCVSHSVETTKWFSKVVVFLQFLMRKEQLDKSRMRCEESVGVGNIFKMEREQLRCLVLGLKEESSTQETEKVSDGDTRSLILLSSFPNRAEIPK